MASLDPITVICPDCGIPIDIGLSATLGDWSGIRTVEVIVSIDPAAIDAHTKQHQTEPSA
jgi:hypothetical protein